MPIILLAAILCMSGSLFACVRTKGACYTGNVQTIATFPESFHPRSGIFHIESYYISTCFWMGGSPWTLVAKPCSKCSRYSAGTYNLCSSFVFIVGKINKLVQTGGCVFGVIKYDCTNTQCQ